MSSKTQLHEYNTDVLILGAGISGINAAYRIQESFLGLSYAIFEGREELGGTWSHFQHPGIRSDSDLHTFGFPWGPWTEERPIADGPSMLKYIKDVASRHGIDQHIQYHHSVTSIEWASEEQRWTIQVIADDTEQNTCTSRFIFAATGLFDYEEGLRSTIQGIEDFEGTVVHP
ncbi:hypothetical protein FSARC_13558 [Fusarium sarcochroum]|uniref:Monooxygenase n=1 Tax=Fusarium sarcochroum TaxID=1208366 RepID=A0A8H4WT10_9HYPO|nr:hypothetical protein FSARC_13558 [Fusarium sarcochroum]